MDRIFKLLPEIEGEEMATVQYATKDMTDEDAQTFAHIYRARRKDPQTVLLFGLPGLFGVPGLQRFYVNQIGLGVLFFLTMGLCFIGTLVDLVNYKRLAQEYNQQVVRDILGHTNSTLMKQ